MAEREQLVFEAVTEQASAEIKEFSRSVRAEYAAMSDGALKLASAEYRLQQAIKNHGAGSQSARNAEIAFRKALQDTSIAAQREAGVLDQATLSKQRFGEAGRYASRGVQHLKTGVVGASAAFLGTTGLVFALQAGVRESIEFDRSMRNVNSIAQLSEEELSSLSRQVLELSNATGKGPKNLADGLYDIVSSGFQADEALAILAASSKAATAGMTDTATASKAVVGILNAYHQGADQARRTSDLLFQEVNLGVNTFEELGQNIGDVVPQAAALGIPLQEILAAIATITRGGTNAPEAFTQLSRVLTSIVKPSKDLRAEFKSMGYDSGQAAVQALGFSGVLERLSQDAGGNQQILAAWLGEVRGIRGIINLTGANLATYSSLLKQMGDATQGVGATQQAFAEQQQSLGFQLQRTTGNFKAAGAAAEQVLNPALVSIVRTGGDAASILTRVANSADEMMNAKPQGGGPTIEDTLKGILEWGNPVNLSLKYTNWWVEKIAGNAERAFAAFESWQSSSSMYYQPGRGPQGGREAPGVLPRSTGAAGDPGATRAGSGGRTQTDYLLDLERAGSDADRLRILRRHKGYVERSIAKLEADKTLTKQQKNRLLDLARELKSTQSSIDQILDAQQSERAREDAERARKAKAARDAAERRAAEQESDEGWINRDRYRKYGWGAAALLAKGDTPFATEISFSGEAPRDLRIQQLQAALTDSTDDDLRVARAIENHWERRLNMVKKTSTIYEDLLREFVSAHDAVKALEQQVSSSTSGLQIAFLNQIQGILQQYAPNYGTYGMAPGGFSSAQAYEATNNLGEQTDLLRRMVGKGVGRFYGDDYQSLSATF